ncbi:hypothetical protein IWQ56_002710 [Coemansia nantahalensis]|nr:hypothetical protein IWQ56_002710 [Coemansia nantahalensis]
MGISSTHYVFTQPMLMAWAACCVIFGVSVSYLGAKKGWIKSDDAEKAALVLAPALEDEVDDTQATTDAMLATAAARECLDNPDEWKRTPYHLPTLRQGPEPPFHQGTMVGPDKIGAEPVVFMNRDLKQFVVIVPIGKLLCGHEGIVHGGVQATLFDEITARPAMRNLPRNTALTASLKINYRRPAVAGQMFVFRTQLTSIDGRKATVAAQLEDGQGNVISDAEALYISPKNMALPDRSHLLAEFESVYPSNF